MVPGGARKWMIYSQALTKIRCPNVMMLLKQYMGHMQVVLPHYKFQWKHPSDGKGKFTKRLQKDV